MNLQPAVSQNLIKIAITGAKMKKSFFPSLILMTCTNFALNADSTTGFKSIPMNEGLQLISKQQNHILLDVRRPDEYAAGHIPGALLLTNETITPKSAQIILPEKNQLILVYCRSGRRSKEASAKLASYGYTNIIEIGGIISYSGILEH